MPNKGQMPAVAEYVLPKDIAPITDLGVGAVVDVNSIAVLHLAETEDMRQVLLRKITAQGFLKMGAERDPATGEFIRFTWTVR